MNTFEVDDIVVCIDEGIITKSKRSKFTISRMFGPNNEGLVFNECDIDGIMGYDAKLFISLSEHRKRCIEKILKRNICLK